MTALYISILLTSFIPLEKVVAVVDNSPILHSEVEEVLDQIECSLTGDYYTDSQTPEYREALDELIENLMLLNAAIDEGFYPTDQEIQALVDEELAENPLESDADIAYLTEAIADYQAVQVFIGRKVQAALQDTPMSPETYLVSNAELVDELIMPRHIGWIYLPILPEGPVLDEAMNEMIGLRERILAGESFQQIASQYSDDGSAAAGGYLGTFGLGQMTYAFENAAFSLEVGELSEPVVTTFGIHLIKLDAKHDDGTIDASHILRIVPRTQNDIDRTMLQAQNLALEIQTSRLSFEDAARLHSSDRSSSEDGGDLGMVPLKLWLMEVAYAVEDLEIGSISDPVILETGAVVLIKLYEETEEINWDSYSEAELNGLIQQVIFQDTYQTVIDSLYNEMPVIYYLEDDAASAY